MRPDEFKEIEKSLTEEVVTRRKLGGFDVHALGILKLCEATLKLTQEVQDLRQELNARHGHSTNPKK